MYYRRNKKPMIIAAFTLVLVTALATAVSLFLSGKEEKTEETEPYLERTDGKRNLSHKNSQDGGL